MKVLRNGFGTVVNPRDNEPELSQGMKLKNLYKEAQENDIGMHKDPYRPIPKIIDLATDKSKFSKYSSILVPNKSKLGQAIVMNKIEAFVEVVLAPNKFRVRLIKDGYLINLQLSGVTSISNDTNSAEFPMYNKSLIFTKRLVSQKKVTVEIENFDKYGNFFGQLTYDLKKSINEDLLKEGFA